MSRLNSARSILFAGAALAAIATTPAFAQEAAAPAAPEAQDSALADTGEIIVTARRREEKLLDVPTAVTALTAAQLDQAGAIDLTDLQIASPNTTLKDARGTNSTLAAFIHIPLLARSGAVRRKGAPRITLEELVDAGEAMLVEMVQLARKARNTQALR